MKKATVDKIELYVLSLWLLFFLVILITIDIPVRFAEPWEFIGIAELAQRNIIPIAAFIALLYGFYCFKRFKNRLEGSQSLVCTVKTKEDLSHEHLTFLTTYIIPLICIDMSNTRYILVLCVLLVLIGAIYVRTNKFYANPSLAILGFRNYSIEITLRNSETKKVVAITRQQIKDGSRIRYIDLGDNIYFARVENGTK